MVRIDDQKVKKNPPLPEGLRAEWIDGGGVSSARGFRAAGIHAGFKKGEALDFALVESERPVTAAAVFTKNTFCAAPVMVSKDHLCLTRQKLVAEREALEAETLAKGAAGTDARLKAEAAPEVDAASEIDAAPEVDEALGKGTASGNRTATEAEAITTSTAVQSSKPACDTPALSGPHYGKARALLINAGNANAATGELGIVAARSSAALAAQQLGCASEEVLIASTGVIGSPIDFSLFAHNMKPLVSALSTEGGPQAAQAIMTTDTVSKECALEFWSSDPDFEGTRFTIGGMVKGSGMIMPDMATMIAALTTDAPLKPAHAHTALELAVAKSFNKVTVDSDTSTNDTCFLLANAAALGGKKGRCIKPGSLAFKEFVMALEAVCVNLAKKIAIDGEGATKLLTVKVRGAASEEDADKAARSIANSPLVKTAVFGHDANWGRVAMALGKSGAAFKPEKVSISLLGIPVCEHGLTIPFDEEEALRRFQAPEVCIKVDLGAGNAKTTIWSCDYSHDYITINGEYRT